MRRYLIIADDFTGANDTGLQFARRGLATRVQIHTARPIAAKYSLVVDTESRNVEERVASELLDRALASLEMDTFDVIMKKIDSTLRGNVVAEVASMQRAMATSTIIVAPAFVAMGRTTVDATVLLNGTPLLQTEIGSDPRKPIETDNLITLFSSLRMNVTHLTVEEIRSGTFPKEASGVFVCDSTEASDLDTIAAWGLSLKECPLFVGSAGLADALINAEVRAKPSFAVVASVSTVTQQQLLYAKQQGSMIVAIPVTTILTGESFAAYTEEASAALQAGSDVILTVSSALNRDDIALSATFGLSSDEVGSRILAAISEVGKAVIDCCEIAGVFLTGGDTAFGLLETLGIKEVAIQREVALGIPLMIATDSQYRGLKIITKAGGFGNKDAISYALRALQEERV